jgi:hypothetical protein
MARGLKIERSHRQGLLRTTESQRCEGWGSEMTRIFVQTTFGELLRPATSKGKFSFNIQSTQSDWSMRQDRRPF